MAELPPRSPSRSKQSLWKWRRSSQGRGLDEIAFWAFSWISSSNPLLCCRKLLLLPLGIGLQDPWAATGPFEQPGLLPRQCRPWRVLASHSRQWVLVVRWMVVTSQISAPFTPYCSVRYLKPTQTSTNLKDLEKLRTQEFLRDYDLGFIARGWTCEDQTGGGGAIQDLIFGCLPNLPATCINAQTNMMTW